MKFLQDAKREGLIKAIGVSTHHVDMVKEFAELDECDVIFPLINYAGLGIRNGSEPGTREEMEEAISYAASKGKGIFTMKAFGGGPLIKSMPNVWNTTLDLKLQPLP